MDWLFLAEKCGIYGALLHPQQRLDQMITDAAAEPEFRLPLVLSYLLFSALGFFVWGQSVYAVNHGLFQLLLVLVMNQLWRPIATTAVADISCSHRELSGEPLRVGFCH